MKDSIYLIDTSVWLEVLPPGAVNPALRERVDNLLEKDQVATMGLVRLELLGGVRTEREYQRLEALLSALHTIPVAEERWDQAAQMGFYLRRQGLTMPFTDLLIAAMAIHAKAILIHRDHHFNSMAAHLPLQVESYVEV